MPLIKYTKFFQQFLCETMSDIDRKNLNKRREKKEGKQKEWLQSTKSHEHRMLSIFFGIPQIVNRESILVIEKLAPADELGEIKKRSHAGDHRKVLTVKWRLIKDPNSPTLKT